jgi:hypothetical protein
MKSNDFLLDLKTRYDATPAGHSFSSERLFAAMAGEFFLLNGQSYLADKNFQSFLMAPAAAVSDRAGAVMSSVRMACQNDLLNWGAK